MGMKRHWGDAVLYDRGLYPGALLDFQARCIYGIHWRAGLGKVNGES